MSVASYLRVLAAFFSLAPLAQSQTGGIARLKLEFVSIRPGEFLMGSDAGEANERPPHRVRITRSFEMGKYEVTQAQWEAVMLENPSRFKGPDQPVETVSWNDTQEFLKRLAAMDSSHRYRLPTEAEWEYAARAGTTGDYAGALDAVAWYFLNSDSRTHPVGQKKPNAWGLYDMHGNVWEWCQDWYEANYYGSSPADDPPGPSGGSSKVLRGGSWGANASYTRVSIRISFDPAYKNHYFGFRLVREAKGR